MSELLDEARSFLEGLTPEERAEVLEQSGGVTAPAWFPTVGPQYDAYYSPADVLLYGGSAGGGKGTRLMDNILTPFGWCKAGDIKVGSAICATDGTVQTVLAVYPRGEQPLYKFTWSDGAETIVDGDHLWLGWWAGEGRKIAGKYITGETGARIWMTRDIFQKYAGGKGSRFCIPTISAPCAFNVAGEKRGRNRFIKRTLPPYVLGVLLGDGNFTKKDISWSKPDREIEVRVRTLMQEARGAPVEIAVYAEDSSSPEFRFLQSSGVKEEIQDLGLIGKGSLEKFIPRMYLFATEAERWELLAGLMDTDGWVEEDGDCYYGSSSPQLIMDVQHLARSLGAIVTMREKTPVYTLKGEKRFGEQAYTIRIKMSNPERMFHLDRKINRCIGKEPQHMARFLDSIEEFGFGETVCFVVSNPNRLYITDDFVVTHNTDLALGLAFTAHKRSLILRRQYTDMSGIVDRAIEINGTRDGFSGAIPPRLRSVDGRLIQFGAHKDLGDEQSFQGIPYDLKVFDEATQHLELQIRFHLGWIRSADPDQRCRALLATNPPMDATGDWIIGMFRPWLDVTHPKPAKPGELRWFITDENGDDVEVDGPTPIERERKGKKVIYQPKSRSFIPSSLADNPFLVNSGYQATLDALPEPIRTAVRDGNFMAARADAERQVIPTQWVIEAQSRWTKDGHRGKRMTAMGYDPSGGGKDPAMLALRYDNWFDALIPSKGSETTDGSMTVAHLFQHRRNGAEIVIDVGGGYAGQTVLRLKDNGAEFTPFNGNGAGQGRDRSGKLTFLNKRAEAWWRMREALDPDQVGGSPIALPNDQALLAELTAPTFTVSKGGIQVESKDEIRKRLGRSTNRADAIIMAYMPAEDSIRKRTSMGGAKVLPTQSKSTRKGPLQRRRGN